MDALWENIAEICRKLSSVTYENLTKIVRYEIAGGASAARDLDSCFENDLDAWMGGGTCFSMTWFLDQKLKALGLSTKLLMGHKRKEKNIHCALLFFYEGKRYLCDPGYLIFEPLEIPSWNFENENKGEAFFPLTPNAVRLCAKRERLELWTGLLNQPMKLRFVFDWEGVSEKEFRMYWSESFSREMMTYPVLNKLDSERGVQYYFQKGNLLIRDSTGSRLEKIERAEQAKTISKVFGLSEELAERALSILDKKM